MKTILTLIKREFNLFYNNKVLLVLFIGAPIMYSVLIGNVYQKGKVTDLPVIVVDEDNSPMSHTFINMLEDNESVVVSAILPSLFNSRDFAIKADATTVVHIPKGFASGVQQNRLPEVTVFVDGSNTLTSNTALMAVNVVAMTMKAGVQIESQKKKGVPEYIASQQYEPFKTTIIKQNIRSGNYLYFMLPGVLITVFQQVLLLGLALSFASEFENKTFKDLATKMPNALGLMLVKVIPYILMSIGIVVLYWMVGVYYHMPLHASFWWFILSTFVFVMAVCGLGILVSILLPSQLKATEVLMVIATPAFIVSGFTWPLSQMPSWIQHISSVIPTTHYLKIFRLLFIQQAETYHLHMPLLALAIITTVCFIAAWIILSIKIKKVGSIARTGKDEKSSVT
ncbi:ABC transporter permease [Sphingobacterium olei]|uniref:Transport permease protein n=1 Tax=Sphingobacterium olei TaxID=2571155 RepID=A0A4U0P2L9_9SPHI|nr:ABC transporter permease [Sphingobacterium olei]